MMAPLDAEAYITSLIDVEVRPQGPSAEEQQAFLDEVASRSGSGAHSFRPALRDSAARHPMRVPDTMTRRW